MLTETTGWNERALQCDTRYAVIVTLSIWSNRAEAEAQTKHFPHSEVIEIPDATLRNPPDLGSGPHRGPLLRSMLRLLRLARY